MSTPTLLTIILNYKTADMTIRSAEVALIAMKGLTGEIIIVDNDSPDGSYETISDHIATHGWDKDNRVRVLQSGHNGGYGAGNNVGIRAGLSDGSAPDFVYILNPDAFPSRDAIRVLLDYLVAHPDAGFAGSCIEGDDGAPHTSTFRYPSIFSEFETAIRFGPITRLLKSHRVPLESPGGTQPVDWLAGASLMMRKSVLDEIGLFDETFFLYFEETDLCRRANLAGYQIVYVRESEVVHIGSVSTGMKTWARVPVYWFDSRLHYFSKNHGGIYTAAATAAHLAGGFLHWLRCVFTRKTRGVSPHFLRSMAVHDLHAMRRAIFPKGSHNDKSTRPQPGE